MARTQLDFLHEEGRLIARVLSPHKVLVLSKSWAEPTSTSNFHVIEGGSRKLTVEVTHKNSLDFCLVAVRDMVKQFGASDSDLCRLTC